MMWKPNFLVATAAGIAFVASASVTAAAEPCPGHPDALGTSRTLVLDPATHPVVGTVNRGAMLPLAPGEVVLTFDDGPWPSTTPAVLDTLAKHCVKATFFMIGRNAKAAPALARAVLAAGHTIGTHTENHPRWTMAPERAYREINTGIAHVATALGDPRSVAPFFRFPGLRHTAYAEQYLHARSIAAWSVDVDSHDWKHITPEQVVDNVLNRLAAKGRGIILMHDVQAKTAAILPVLLAELKQRGYRVVHVVPPQRPAVPPDVVAAAPVAAPNVVRTMPVVLRVRTPVAGPAPVIRLAAKPSTAMPLPLHPTPAIRDSDARTRKSRPALAPRRADHVTGGGVRQRRPVSRLVAARGRRALYR